MTNSANERRQASDASAAGAPRRRRQPAMYLFLLLGATLAIAASGCRGSHRADATQTQRPAEVLRQLTRCIRANGVPNFPDLVIGRDGTPTLPASAPRVPATTRHACQAIADRLPPQYTSTQPVSSADFNKLLQFARCMRAHGLPDWPDPNALGEFPLDRRLIQGGKRLALGAAQACARLNPNPRGGINAIQAP